MPQEYLEEEFDYRTAGMSFTDWLENKHNTDEWELQAVLKSKSNYVDKHILRCIFRRKVA